MAGSAAAQVAPRQARRQLRVPPFSGLPLHLQRELALVAWTALAVVDHPAGRDAALADLAAAARTVHVLVPEARDDAGQALVALASADALPAPELRRRCAPMVEVFDAVLARVRWATLIEVMGLALRR